MKSHAAVETGAFDRFAGHYDTALARGLAVSGESKEYFAERRVMWLASRLEQLRASVRTILDFGCGTGTSTPFLLSIPGVQQVLGVDTSARCLEIARQTWDPRRTQFELYDTSTNVARVDLAFCNGVFHHIEPRHRGVALDYISRALERGGYFAFWENNPWNPGTRYVMRRIPFDRDARVLSPPAARQLLHEAGFAVLRTEFLFLFPRALRALRPLEARLARLPLGAQYLILSQKP